MRTPINKILTDGEKALIERHRAAYDRFWGLHDDHKDLEKARSELLAAIEALKVYQTNLRAEVYAQLVV